MAKACDSVLCFESQAFVAGFPYRKTILWHPEGMARGWESKDVESQMEDARESRRSTASQLSPQEIQLQRERDALLLQRTRVLADLQSAQNPRYREILQRSLTFLEDKLAALPDPPARNTT